MLKNRFHLHKNLPPQLPARHHLINVGLGPLSKGLESRADQWAPVSTPSSPSCFTVCPSTRGFLRHFTASTRHEGSLNASHALQLWLLAMGMQRQNTLMYLHLPSSIMFKQEFFLFFFFFIYSLILPFPVDCLDVFVSLYLYPFAIAYPFLFINSLL